MKIPYLFKVHQISSNLQNLLESSSETCMWNLSPFGEVKIFHEKMPTEPAIEILWKFHTFSKFTKFHQTYRIYWNHHLKHACEIWVHSEKLKFFMKKCRQCWLQKYYENSTSFQSSPNFIKLTEFTGIIIWNMHVKFESIRRSWNFLWKNADSASYRNIMKIPYLFKVHQISSNLQNLLESSSETCMWNLSPFVEVKNFHEKCRQSRLYWNHHLKHAWKSIQRKLKFFMKKCRQCRL